MDIRQKNYFKQKLSKQTKLLLIGKIKGLSLQSKSYRKKYGNDWIRYILSNNTRLHLLAYAYLRKKPYKLIEQTCANNNKPNVNELHKIIVDLVSSPYFSYSNEIKKEMIQEWLNE